MAVTRAQYEVGIVMFKDIREWGQEEEFITYLKAVQSEHVRIFDQFTADPPCNIGWLNPSDDDTYGTDWWERRLGRFLQRKAEDVTELFSCQTASVRLQISLAFPRLFDAPTSTHDSQSKNSLLFNSQNKRLACKKCFEIFLQSLVRMIKILVQNVRNLYISWENILMSRCSSIVGLDQMGIQYDWNALDHKTQENTLA